jgi:hypothetical protein
MDFATGASLQHAEAAVQRRPLWVVVQFAREILGVNENFGMRTASWA